MVPQSHDFGLQDYASVWRGMRSFTDNRDADTVDQLWMVEHPAVFTLGQNGKPEHILNPGDISIVTTDRGGQVTYHGPGQQLMYVLLDLRRRKLGVRALVTLLERSVIELLAGYGVAAEARADAPGVYVEGAKVAALGLRVRKGCSYHGVSLNVDMDLTPFGRINPCGFSNLPVTQLSALGIAASRQDVAARLSAVFTKNLG